MTEKEYNICVNQFSDMVYCYLLKNIKNTESAKDITQDTFIALWTHIDAVELQKAKAFLFITAHNFMINEFKRIKRTDELQENVSYTTAEENKNFENSDFVDKLLEQLPQHYRQCLILKDIDGFSYEEISQILKLTLSAVKNIILRARVMMKEFALKEIQNNK